MTEWISSLLFFAGATLALLAAIGVLRMPDVFTRMQASTKAATLGLGCLLAGLAIQYPEVAIVSRAGTIAAFMMLTTSVSAHAIARAAAMTGAPLWEGTLIDERPASRATAAAHALREAADVPAASDGAELPSSASPATDL